MLAFVFQTLFVQSALKLVGGEYNAVCAASGAIAIATALELRSSLHFFLLVVCPIVAVANSILRLSLRSLVTQTAPKESLGSILAALDVMQNAFSVSVPFYRTFLFNRLAYADENEDSEAAMKGDPNPQMWLKSSLLHWLIATAIMVRLLLNRKRYVKKDM